MSKEVLKIALEALEPLEFVGKRMDGGNPKIDKAITAIKEALANEALEKMAENARELGLDYEPEQKPVAWVSSEELLVMRGNALGGAKDWRINVGLVKQNGDVGLYTIPPQRTWVGLTNEERAECWETIPELAMRKVEAKLRSKNESKN